MNSAQVFIFIKNVQTIGSKGHCGQPANSTKEYSNPVVTLILHTEGVCCDDKYNSKMCKRDNCIAFLRLILVTFQK